MSDPSIHLEDNRLVIPGLRMQPSFPIIQGGMAVRISLNRLASAVAHNGGMGVVALSGLQAEEAYQEIVAAKEITDGLVGVNVMVAVTNFKELVEAAIRAEADFIIVGAGFSRDVFKWCKDAGVPLFIMVGSARVAKLAEKFGAAAVVAEGIEAGGHLGTELPVRELLREVLAAVDIPVFAAGGIATGADVHEMLSLGAAGVQIGSRFAATEESSAPDDFKQMYVKATEDDLTLIDSPVGLPGRAIKSRFTDQLETGDVPRIEGCITCIHKCGKEFCIMDKLVRAQGGDVVDGLVFAGEGVLKIHDVLTVPDLMDRLEQEYYLAATGGSV